MTKQAVSKRTLLKGAAGMAVSVLPTWRRADAATAYDVIVVGAGTAGIPSAIFAAERGAKVLVIEKAPIIGGTLDRSTGQMSAAGTVFQKAKGIVDTPDMHYEDNMRISRNTADPVITRLIVDNAGETLNWLAANGFTIGENQPLKAGGHEGFRTARYQWGAEGGRSILHVMEPLLQKAIDKGRVNLMLNTGAVDLIQDAKGAVVGVTVEDDKGVATDIMARNVVLASGGCCANPRMFEDLHGAALTAQIAYPYGQGVGLLLGLGAGGYVRGGEHYTPLFGTLLADDNFPSPIDGNFDSDPGSRPPWEIYVNMRGERFMAEDNPSVDYREQSLRRQPHHKMWVISDHQAFEKTKLYLKDWTKEKYLAAFGTHPMFAKADNLEALGVKAGVDPHQLKLTVGSYNAAIASSSTDAWGRTYRPAQISQGPFYAVRMMGWTVKTFAGLAIDGGLRVVRADGTPIPNLYAAGELIGGGITGGASYVNGMMVTPALTFARLLGQKYLKLKA